MQTPDRAMNLPASTLTSAAKFAASHEGPVFIRVSRMPVPELSVPNREFRPGKAELVREGSDLTIIACGTTVHLAVAAAETLAATGVSARVLNFSSINPLDEEAILAAAETGAIVTVEEHSVRGGLGGAVAELIATRNPVPMEIMGFPGFVPTGSVQWLFDHFGLTAAGIEASARKALSRKRS